MSLAKAETIELKGKRLADMEPERLAAGIEAGLRRLGQYTAAAEALGEEMAREDGVAAAADIIEACLR
jgi:UDP:flavonoid glycosyltransferase YjiC (YdhE family)